MPTPTPMMDRPRVPGTASAPASLRTTFLLPPCFHSESSWKQLSRPLGEINQVQRLTGAPEKIRTPDPQIRRLWPSDEISGDFCKPGLFRRSKDQRLRSRV